MRFSPPVTALAVAGVILCSWHESAVAQWTPQNSSTPGYLSGVTHGNGLYVAVGFEGEVVSTGVIVSSPDGTAWTPESPGVVEALRDVTHAEGLFVAVGRQGTILTSPDGQAWTARNSGTTAFLGSIAHGNGTFVAVGALGAIVTSPDGINWSTANSMTNSSFESVSHGGGVFLAVGASAVIRTSVDGTTWESKNLGFGTVSLNAGAFFKGKHYIAGQVGAIFCSDDLLSWSLVDSQTPWKHALLTDGTQLVAAGEQGDIRISADGTTWTSDTSGVTQNICGSIFADAQFVLVGEPAGNPVSGLVLTAPGTPDPDCDDDKLLDVWEEQHFGSKEVWSGTDDPEKDSLKNIVEFVHDLDPNQSDAGSDRLPELTVEAGGMAIQWTWKREHADFAGVDVCFSDTLEDGDWQQLNLPVELVSDDGNGIETVKVVDPGFLTVPRRFYKLSYGTAE